jgi:hypothetical protein
MNFQIKIDARAYERYGLSGEEIYLVKGTA